MCLDPPLRKTPPPSEDHFTPGPGILRLLRQRTEPVCWAPPPGTAPPLSWKGPAPGDGSTSLLERPRPRGQLHPR